MSDDKLTFLDEMPDEATELEQEPEQVEAQAEAPEPAEEAAERTGEEQAEPPSAAEEHQRNIPVTALLDEREKRQKAEREAEEARKEAAQLRQWREMQARQAPQEKPDFFENPEQVVQQQIMQVKLEQSRFLADREFGKEAVDDAVSFFNDPKHMHLSHRFLNEPSPFHAAVEYVKRQKFLSEVGDDPEKWREAERERIRQELLAQAPQPSKPKAPPPSMAAAPSRGGDAIAPGNAFDAMFGDS